MFKLNNKGQTLVAFVVIFPILLLVITLVFDVGNAIYEKNSLSNTNYMAVDYGLDNIKTINENDLIDFIMKNNNNLNYISVNIGEDNINIKTSKNIKGIIGNMFNFTLIEANSEYIGTIKDSNKRIERIK